MPERIQLSRRAGWRKPDGAIVVARPSRWGNPFRLNDRATGLVHFRPVTPSEFAYEGRISAPGTRHDYWAPDGGVTEFHVRWATRSEIVELYRRTLLEPDEGMQGAYPSRGGHFAPVDIKQIRDDLAGHDLACWCPLDEPCHADVLLDIANSG